MLSSLSSCLTVKLLISASNLNESPAGWSVLGCGFFPFITLNIVCHSLLACRVSVKNHLMTLGEFLLMVSFFGFVSLLCSLWDFSSTRD